MDFLALCKKVRQDAGISGTGPASVISQTGVYAKIVNWVSQAYEDIQTDRKGWTWRHLDFEFQTQALVSDYPPALGQLSHFFKDDINIYLTSDGKATERKIEYIDYARWKRDFSTGVVTENYPRKYTIAKDGSLRLAPTPDAIYTVSGDGQRELHTLVDNTDVPLVPEELHQAIVEKAIVFWAMDQEAEQERQYHLNLYRGFMTRMRRDYLPEIKYGYASL